MSTSSLPPCKGPNPQLGPAGGKGSGWGCLHQQLENGAGGGTAQAGCSRGGHGQRWVLVGRLRGRAVPSLLPRTAGLILPHSPPTRPWRFLHGRRKAWLPRAEPARPPGWPDPQPGGEDVREGVPWGKDLRTAPCPPPPSCPRGLDCSSAVALPSPPQQPPSLSGHLPPADPRGRRLRAAHRAPPAPATCQQPAPSGARKPL